MGETDYTGIDYSMGTVNFNRETGIRYGVIPIDRVLQAWVDESEAFYGDEEDEPEEPISFFVKNNSYLLEQWQDNPDIWVFESPYFTYAQFCSPCAPGACDLDNWLSKEAWTDNNKCYCLGHEWFESGKAPYPVFSVETKKEVKPDEC